MVLHLPWDRPPLSDNDRKHWRAKATAVKGIRETVQVLARLSGLPRGLEHVWVEYVWRAPDNRRRDSDNLNATTKPLYDGLTDYGIVKDDTPEFMTKLPPVILKKNDPREPTIKGCAVIITWEKKKP